MSRFVSRRFPRNPAFALHRGLEAWFLALPGPSTGLQCVDIAGRNLHAAHIARPTWESAVGRPGGWGSLGCDGSASYATAPFDARLCGTSQDAFTVMAWSRALNTTGVQSITGVGTAAGAGQNYTIYHNGTSLVFRVSVGASVTDLSIATGFATGVWQCDCLAYDGANLVGYTNGAQVGTTAKTGTPTNVDVFYIGTLANVTPLYFFAGRIDDVRVWSRGLSATEVLLAYQESRQGYKQSLNWITQRRRKHLAGGTTFTQTLTGTFASSGLAPRLTMKALTGAV